MRMQWSFRLVNSLRCCCTFFFVFFFLGKHAGKKPLDAIATASIWCSLCLFFRITPLDHDLCHVFFSTLFFQPRCICFLSLATPWRSLLLLFIRRCTFSSFISHIPFFLLPVQLVYCLFLVAKPIEWPNRCLYLSVGVHCGTQVESTQQIAMVQSNFKTFTTLIITG